jgi:DNA-binding phage protein
MIDLDELRKLLKTMNLTKIADETGVPYGRIWRLAHTEAEPSFDTVKRVAVHLESLKLTKVA